MSEHKCGNCKQHEADKETGTGRRYCLSDKSAHCGEWTTDGFVCGAWEQGAEHATEAPAESPGPDTPKPAIRQRLLEGDWHDKTPKEIAEALGVSAGGVNSALSILRREGVDVPHVGTERKKGGRKTAENPKKADGVASTLEAGITDLTAECPTISETETVGRAECLSRALACVCGEREDDYGTPEDSFGKIAALWSAYRGETYTAQDVAVMMALLKIARIGGGRATVDSWVDLAGYAACGCEISTRETET